ncbi:hypothetical protein ACFLZG_07410, partial [Thermodesulfobacteriota bacterium]
MALIDSGRLFIQKDAFLSRTRQDVRKALGQLLIWERPVLQSTKGIEWPYESLKRRFSIFEKIAQESKNNTMKLEAQLFLGLLPFPKQWERLTALEKNAKNHPDMQTFLSQESAKIAAKIQHKPQRHFLLRHLCQVLKSFQSPKEKGILRLFAMPYLWVRPDLLNQISRKFI